MATRTDYNVKITSTSKELSAREKIKLKDTTNAIKLDTACDAEALIIPVDMYAELSVHNEKSDNKDYMNYMIISTDGQKYVTGSMSFWNAFCDIIDELADAGEPIEGIEISVYKLPSKNYTGKEFITCSLI